MANKIGVQRIQTLGKRRIIMIKRKISKNKALLVNEVLELMKNDSIFDDIIFSLAREALKTKTIKILKTYIGEN